MRARQVLAAVDPWRPSPDEARAELRRELLRPEYEDRDLTTRLLNWVIGLFDRVVGAASSVSLVTTAAAVVVLAALFTAVLVLLGRTRAATRRPPPVPRPVVEAETGAADLRLRAEQALADGRYEDALVDGFRALARGSAERGRIEDVPGATAHEVAEALAERYDGWRTEVTEVATRFDAVRYGDQVSSREEAEAVLALDRRLVVEA